MPRALIITSYLDYPLDIPALLRPDDYIVCLDGGFDIARSQGIRPHLLLGDFDSLQEPLPAELTCGASGIQVRQYPPEKDYTDLELSFLLLDPEDYPDLLVIGGLGGRLDHTMANIDMLQRYTALPDCRYAKADRGADFDDYLKHAFRYTEPLHRFRRITLQDGRNQCFVLQGRSSEQADPVRCLLPRTEHSYLSVFALSQACTGLSMRGVKYPLEDFTLQRGISLCTSNEFEANQAEILLGTGSLLVIVAGA